MNDPNVMWRWLDWLVCAPSVEAAKRVLEKELLISPSSFPLEAYAERRGYACRPDLTWDAHLRKVPDDTTLRLYADEIPVGMPGTATEIEDSVDRVCDALPRGMRLVLEGTAKAWIDYTPQNETWIARSE